MKLMAIEPEEEEGAAAGAGTTGAAETMLVRRARAEIVKAFIVSFLLCVFFGGGVGNVLGFGLDLY